MTAFFNTIGLIFVLLAVISVLIVIPAVWLGVASNSKVIFLAISYFCFFLGTIWRVVRYGEIASREQDRQLKVTSGRIASLVRVIGLLGVHWLTLYTFSLQAQDIGQTLDWLLNAIAVSLMIAAIIISQIAIATLGKFFDRLTIKSDHHLVTEGIYSVVRHPIYTSYVLLFVGFCTMLQSLWGLSLLVVVCLVWFGNRIELEEQMLQERFGQEYQSYCQRTKRLFPYIY